jgi:hypothetical protein
MVLPPPFFYLEWQKDLFLLEQTQGNFPALGRKKRPKANEVKDSSEFGIHLATGSAAL